MTFDSSIVLPNGVLSENSILKREILYKGMNERNVERFYLTPSHSYIFKPLTNNEQMGKEEWVYEHILPSFPPIYPKIIAKSSDIDPSLHWIIFEDLGTLNHVFDEKIVLGVTKLMAWWHSFPTGNLVTAALKGPKPFIHEIVSEVLFKKGQFIKLSPTLGLPTTLVRDIYSALQKESFSKWLVLSHGDLHLGNYALANKKIIVLDWEHTHLNTPFWDLYHLIDMSHPIFPKTVNSQFRNLILEYYVEQIEFLGGKINRQAFLREYYMFSCVFSIWMIMVIQRDLINNDGKWSEDKLTSQLNETISNLMQCLDQIYSFN
jgi:hypothetical protein